jgi:hypothetical protein
VINTPLKPQNLPETLVWYYILYTYPIYFLGAQFVLAPLLATFLTGYLLNKWWHQTEETPAAEKITISPSAWVWVIAMLILEVALIVGHFNFDLGMGEIIRSSVLWYRTWALWALFPLVGHLHIRPKLIYRAVCILCLQSLIMVVIGNLATVGHIPNIHYISPLKALGGGAKPYEVDFFHNSISERLKLFAVWPTILAFICNVYFCFALGESDKRWKFIGMFSSVVMVALSQSRTASLALPFVLLTVWVLTNFIRPWVQFATGFVSALAGMFAPALIDSLKSFKAQFDKARAGSSKIRKIIYRLSLDHWWNEARIWGHGVRAEKGPPITVNLPFGSHHTWFGVLYLHGLVGFVTLAITFFWTFVDLLIKAQTSDTAKMGLRILFMIFICSLADNLEFFAYLYWPALIVLGAAFKESQSLSSDHPPVLYEKLPQNIYS